MLDPNSPQFSKQPKSDESLTNPKADLLGDRQRQLSYMIMISQNNDPTSSETIWREISSQNPPQISQTKNSRTQPQSNSQQVFLQNISIEKGFITNKVVGGECIQYKGFNLCLLKNHINIHKALRIKRSKIFLYPQGIQENEGQKQSQKNFYEYFPNYFLQLFQVIKPKQQKYERYFNPPKKPSLQEINPFLYNLFKQKVEIKFHERFLEYCSSEDKLYLKQHQEKLNLRNLLSKQYFVYEITNFPKTLYASQYQQRYENIFSTFDQEFIPQIYSCKKEQTIRVKNGILNRIVKSIRKSQLSYYFLHKQNSSGELLILKLIELQKHENMKYFSFVNVIAYQFKSRHSRKQGQVIPVNVKKPFLFTQKQLRIQYQEFNEPRRQFLEKFYNYIIQLAFILQKYGPQRFLKNYNLFLATLDQQFQQLKNQYISIDQNYNEQENFRKNRNKIDTIMWQRNKQKLKPQKMSKKAQKRQRVEREYQSQSQYQLQNYQWHICPRKKLKENPPSSQNSENPPSSLHEQLNFQQFNQPQLTKQQCSPNLKPLQGEIQLFEYLLNKKLEQKTYHLQMLEIDTLYNNCINGFENNELDQMFFPQSDLQNHSIQNYKVE